MIYMKIFSLSNILYTFIKFSVCVLQMIHTEILTENDLNGQKHEKPEEKKYQICPKSIEDV